MESLTWHGYIFICFDPIAHTLLLAVLPVFFWNGADIVLLCQFRAEQYPLPHIFSGVLIKLTLTNSNEAHKH
jgi:hypothetical protein